MKMCELTAELLPALAENMLGAAQANEVRAHLSTCADCVESWKTQELISRHFRETDLAADRPDYFWTKQRKHILDEVGLGTSRFEQAAPPRGGLVRFALVAAAAVLVAVGAYAILKPTGAAEGSGGVVKTAPPKTNDGTIAQDPPKPAPEAPVDQPKEELVQKPDPPKEETPPPVPDRVVENPAPAPDPKKEEPKPKDLVQEPKPKPDNTTPPKAPPKVPPAAPKPEELAILPGSPKYASRLAVEQAEVLIPVSADTKTPLVKDIATTEQALAFLRAGGARLDDMRAMHALDPKADLTEMVDAYAILVGDSAAKVLYLINADGRAALGTRAELRSHQAALAKFPESLQKGALAPAVQACAAAIDLKIRPHKPGTRGLESGALASARESAHLLSAGGANVVKRASIGLAFSTRYVGSIVEHAKLGRIPQAEGEVLAYQKMVESVVRMLEWLEPKDQGGMCARAKVDLAGYMARFKQYRGPEPLKGLMDSAADWTSNMIVHVSKVEAFYQGKVKDFPKRDPAPPPKDPPPSAPPPPPAPPFGEKPPDPPPPPPPQPPFGEQP